ncbi:restriction endonuclease subunit S [Helicobacter pylori]|uniref:restriction endonuclease subunit S n=2 Tax=Helicobacter pylori TaxID=210 RepID=UPI00165B89C9|nr:restriction endonuclease subunit S [Helicobacter pylori]MBH0240686.1 restriction endonuclease subunit S [Helicobacter pylori]
MHKIEQLLQTLAPKGVEFRKLGEVLEYDQPNKYCVTSKEFDKSYPTPVLTAGKTFILGYTNEKDNIYQASKSSPVIIFDDFTTATQWVDFPFKVKSSAMKILLPKNPTINIRFIFFYMQTIPYNIGGEHARHWISRYSQLEVPIPPLEIQQEIVKILDAFTELNTELNTELKARKKQYQYYQNMLLDFNDINQNHKDAKERLAQKPYPKRLKTLLQTLAPKGVEFRKLGDIGEYIRGVTYKKNQEINNLECGIKVLRANNITLSNHLNFEDIKVINKNVKIRKEQYLKKNDILICAGSGSSEHIGKVAFIDTDFDYVFGGFMGVIRIREVNSRFVYHIFTSNIFKQYLEKSLNTTTINNLNANILQNFLIPIPPLEIQQEIVTILDQFLALTTDLLAGIPAEIEARKKQYEYYREKLLAFKPLTPNKEVKKG